jgi:hypothetical protein
MTKFNTTYRKKALQIVDQVDTVGFGFQNSAPMKIAGSKKLAFSLPAGPDFTCPGATEACKDCYAQKGRHIFENVQKVMVKNWITLSYFAARNDIAGAADHLLDIIAHNDPIFRIHESGDFDSQFAVEVWTQVARARPNTKFWFYTRSFHLDFKNLLALSNVSGWASTDPFNTIAAKVFADKYKIKQAFGPWEHKAELPANSFVCPVTNGKLELNAACEKCKLCVMKDRTSKNVVFLGH